MAQQTNDWTPTALLRDAKLSSSPQGHLVASGYVHYDVKARFKNNDYITTAAIVEVNGDSIKTKKGDIYRIV